METQHQHTGHDPSGHQDHGVGGPNAMAASATLHCLTGCAIGEIAGLVIGTALGLGNAATIAVSITLAFVLGFVLGGLVVSLADDSAASASPAGATTTHARP